MKSYGPIRTLQIRCTSTSSTYFVDQWYGYGGSNRASAVTLFLDESPPDIAKPHQPSFPTAKAKIVIGALAKISSKSSETYSDEIHPHLDAKIHREFLQNPFDYVVEPFYVSRVVTSFLLLCPGVSDFIILFQAAILRYQDNTIGLQRLVEGPKTQRRLHQMILIGWRVVLLFLSLILTLAESSSTPWSMWSTNLGAGQTLLYKWTIFSASFCVLVALFLSTYLIFEHLAAYNQAEEQKFLIGVVLMVPVYALESYLSLMDADAAFNYEIIRDWYEAFALYCFARYLIACLGGEDSTIEFMESKSVISYSIPLIEESYTYGVVEHPFPLNCLLKEWYLGSDFYQAVKFGIVQYMILKLLCSVLAMFFQFIGVYGEGKFEWGYAYPYIAVVFNFSQTWALYCLVQFYSVTKDKLAPIKPLAKFLTFKSIVFLTWWQGVAVAALFSMGAFKGSLANELQTRIQDYIICIEMGVAAVVHLYVFPAAPYKRGERCVRDVSVMTDYASLGAPPDPEEVRDSERTPKLRLGLHDDRPKRPKLHQSVRDVVFGSGEIIVDDMKFTVSHVVEPVERGIAKINKTFHEISQNVKRHEERRRPKDDSYLIPLTRSNEFSEIQRDVEKGSSSDSKLSNTRRSNSKTPFSQFTNR